MKRKTYLKLLSEAIFALLITLILLDPCNAQLSVKSYCQVAAGIAQQQMDMRLAWRISLASGRVAGSNKRPAVTGWNGNAYKARAVSRNGASEGSMRQNPYM